MDNKTFPIGLTVVAILMIIFGVAEIITGFNHHFFVVSTSATSLSTILGATIGAFYALGGCLVLTKRKWAATTAIVLLIIDIIGRITMVITGLYPVDSAKQTFAIIAGTLIAALFAFYIGMKRNAFK